jgi:uncharacterized protein (DUF58 family)
MAHTELGPPSPASSPRPAALTRHGVIVIGLAVLLTFLGALVRSWALGLMAVPLLAALVAAAWAPARAPPGLRATLVAPGRMLDDDQAEAWWVLEAARPAGTCEVVADLPEGTRATAGQPSTLARLGKGTLAAPFTLEAGRRGVYRLRLWVRERSPFGLFALEHEVEGSALLQVHPRFEPLDALPALSRRHRHILGPVLLGRPGLGQEFYGLRPYLPGDPIDAVNWKQTAKHNRPIVNEVEHETPADLVLVVDARELALAGSGRTEAVEACIRGALALAERALRDRYRVGLLVATSSFAVEEPATGRYQWERILRRLVETVPGGRASLLDMLAGVAPDHLPRGAHLILLSPCIRDASLPKFVEQLVHKGVRVHVIAPAPALPKAAGDGSEAGFRLEVATRLAALDRRDLLRQLRDAGAGAVLEWDPADPLAVVIAGVDPRRR